MSAPPVIAPDPDDAGPAPARSTTRLWLVARVLLVLAAIALLVAAWFALRPVENPGVQSCGSPLTFAMGGDNVRLRLSDPALTPELATRVDQPTCRERTDEQLRRAGLALVVFIALGLLGAVLGLVDDRLALRRAPRFESLLRDRPDGVPARRWDRPVVPVDDVGRRLPDVEGRDVARLVTGGVLVLLGLLVVVGVGDGVDAVRQVGIGPLLGLLVLVVVGWGLTLLERDAAHRPPPTPRGVHASAPVGVGSASALVDRVPAAIATSFVSPVLPEFGAAGLDAHDEVEQGTPRRDAVAAAGALVLVAAAVHAALLVLVGLVVLARGLPDAPLPAGGVVVVVVAVLVAVAGAVTAPRRWRQLVVAPHPSSWDGIRARGRDPLALAQLVATAAGLALVPGVGVWLAVGAVGGDLRVDVALGLGLLAVALGALLGPWPAGVGLVEAVLVLGLWRAGVGPAEAVAAVIVLRVVLLWLPIAPGAVAARRLETTA